MKRTLISASAIAVATMFSSVSAETAKPIGGWSDIGFAGGIVKYDSTNAATNDTAFTVMLTRPKKSGADWPAAIAVGALTDKNFEGVTGFVLEYTVNSVKPEVVSGINFGISTVDEKGGFQIDREEPTTKKWYGSFNATLSGGTSKVGVKQTDTILVDSDALYLSYAGDSMADEDVLTALGYKNPVKETDGDLVLLKDNKQVLETTAGVFFHISSDIEKSDDEISLTLHKMEVLKGDPQIILSDKGFKLSNNIVTGFSKNGITFKAPVTGAYEISLLGANGRLLEKKSAQLSANTAKEVSISKTTSGVYFVKIEGNGINMTEKVSLK